MQECAIRDRSFTRRLPMLLDPMVESNNEEERLVRIEQTLKYLVRNEEVLKILPLAKLTAVRTPTPPRPFHEKTR